MFGLCAKVGLIMSLHTSKMEMHMVKGSEGRIHLTTVQKVFDFSPGRAQAGLTSCCLYIPRDGFSFSAGKLSVIWLAQRHRS